MTHGIKLTRTRFLAGMWALVSRAFSAPAISMYLAMVMLNILGVFYGWYSLIMGDCKLIWGVIASLVIAGLGAQVLIFTYFIFINRIGPLLSMDSISLWNDKEGLIVQRGERSCIQTRFVWKDISQVVVHLNLGYVEVYGQGTMRKAGKRELVAVDSVTIPLKFNDNDRILKELKSNCQNYVCTREKVFNDKVC